MNKEGPELAILTRRLSESPPEVLGGVAPVIVAAVLSDTLRDLGGVGLSAREAAALVPTDTSEASRNRARWLLLGAWLLRDSSLQSADAGTARRAQDWLGSDLKALGEALDAREVLGDADRREELARRALRALNLRPRGETKAQAQDRLKTLDSVERGRVILEMRRAQERARQVREEMARKAAEDAAARYGRE